MAASFEIDSLALVLSLILPFLFLVVVLALFKKKKGIKKNKQKLGIEAVNYVSQLIKMLQKHRGLSYGYLRGDEQMRNSLLQIESKIMSHLDLRSPELLMTEEVQRWEGFRNHWKRLLYNNLKNSAENNLEQHNRMIGNLLFLVEDLVENSFLIEIEAAEAESKSSPSWLSILKTAEWTGQARALGTGIAASSKCSSVERIRIKFVRGKVFEYSQALNTHESDLFASQADRDNMLIHFDRFLSTLDQKLIEPEKPTVEASDYFDLATRAIDSLIDLFDEKLADCAKCLEQGNDTNASKKRVAVVASTASA